MKGKRAKKDTQLFQLNLIDNIIQLHEDLGNQTYKHSAYENFYINDPKPRHIHKATVRDRVVHRAIYRILYPFFSRTFITNSFSCQLGKGMHKALNRFRSFGYGVSKNNTKTTWILKCDIRKFFENINHQVLKDILKSYISDEKILWLLENIVDSFYSRRPGIGLPLGNLTSQLFVNIYMNEFDQFIKHKIKARYYIRYADDFVVFAEDRNWLESILSAMQLFLKNNLCLEIHPKKLFFRTLVSGIDFLGWVHFFDHRILRTTTKRRMLKRVAEHQTEETLRSYLGHMGWGNTQKIRQKLFGS